MNQNILSKIIDKVKDQHIKDEEDKIYAYTVVASIFPNRMGINGAGLQITRAKFPSITKASSLEDLYLQIFYSNMSILLTDFLLDNVQNVNIQETLELKVTLGTIYDTHAIHDIRTLYSHVESHVYENWKMKAKNNQDYINKLICLYIKSIEVKLDSTSYTGSDNHVYITKMCP